jgi:hypothetical protein
MNCRAAQQKITDSLAAGVTTLPPDVAAHGGSCEECRAFYQQECLLFGSIDAGLQSMVNPPVPLSFFIRVRVRLEETPAAHPFWIPRRTLVALVATVLVVLSGLVSLNQLSRRSPSPEAKRVAARVDREPVAKAPAGSDETIRSPAAPVPAPGKSFGSRDQVGTAAPDVIVLAEEKQAFVRFIAHVLQGVAMPSALKPVVPQQADAPIDIALIKIQDVEIVPLDSMNAYGQ